MRLRTANNRYKRKHMTPFVRGIERATQFARTLKLKGIRLDGQSLVLHYPSGKFWIEENNP